MNDLSFEILLLSLTTLLFAIVLGFILSKYFFMREKYTSLRSGPQVPKGHKSASTILLGIRSVGKTSLAYSLTGKDYSSRALTTLGVKLMDATIMIDEERKLFLSVLDGPGDNYGDFVRQIIEAQKEPYSPYRSDQISSLILVVDLVYPDSNIAFKNRTHQSMDKDRIQEHIDTWQKINLEVISALASPKPKFILFINKLDLVYSDTNSYKNIFSPITDRIHKIGITDTHVIEGSVMNGDGIQKLKNLLFESVESNFSKKLGKKSDYKA